MTLFYVIRVITSYSIHYTKLYDIARLSSNSDKIDSLIYLSTMNFEKMDSYLRSQKRSNLRVRLVTGTWLESLYLATQVAAEKQNESLIERIA